MATTTKKRPAAATRAKTQARVSSLIPFGVRDAEVEASGRLVSLTNLEKPFWPKLGVTKGDLLRYYADPSPRCCSRISTIARW